MNRKRVIALLLALTLAAAPAVNVLAEESGRAEDSVRDKEEIKKEQKKDEDEDDQEEEQITSLEDANETIETYRAEDSETEWEEIYIRSEADWASFVRRCRLDTWSQNKKVYLTQDLDLARIDEQCVPTFGGYFDGQGNTIRGLSIQDPVSYAGLFCYTQRSAVIVNLNVNGNIVPDGKRMAVGGIVGDNSGILMNCTFDGKVTANDYVGGLAGFNEASGILIECTNKGSITGAHYTGGMVGENDGNIVSCTNEADVNITNEDKGMSLEDINLADYANGLLDLDNNNSKADNSSALNNTVDTGGIAGLSSGIIQYSTNSGTVGYEHVGYNVGGIVGRQSGYVLSCENTGKVYGRKDVGGIAGQAEPYVAVDLSEDIAYQLTDNINELHDLIDTMLDDAGSESDTISNRLSIIQGFADKALDNTSYLADRTVEWADGMVGAANETMSRIDYVMDEDGKDGGVVDQTNQAVGNGHKAVEDLGNALDALDVYQYLSEDEKKRYDDAKEQMQKAAEEYNDNYTRYVKAYDQYYIAERAANATVEVTDADGNTTTVPKYQGNNPDYAGATETDIKPVKESTINESWTFGTVGSASDYIGVDYWDHCKYDGSGLTSAVELGKTDDETQNKLDNELKADAAKEVSDHSTEIDTSSRSYADAEYAKAHPGHTYTKDVTDWTQTIYDIVMAHTDEMSEAARKDAEKAVDNLQAATGNLKTAGSETKRIWDTVNGMYDIVLPQLGSEYRSTTNSLATNLKGISENMGYLNGEMNGSSDVLLDDMKAITDKFSSIMLLYTDAIDGVLDMDYSTAFEDVSVEDADTSTDATIADSHNGGVVQGDINVAGIAGTMAIEYDFDLESDVTGIDDARANSTFLTKCVMRQNKNTGKITAQKSYAGGISGRQEMGIILRCENYGTVKSNSGDYVGGIAGQSLSYILNSYAKCTVSGDEYVAGITGSGSDIEDCYAMVRPQDTTAFAGAIAGEVDETGTVLGNYFVADDMAGIDRISYSGKAEPITYAELMNVEGIPKEFDTMRITFYADDVEVAKAECAYGGSLSETLYPDIPVKDGFYADWDVKELKNVTFDTDVMVEYVRYLTTLAGAQKRDNKQSVLLVDGSFKQGSVLSVGSETEENYASLKNITECWKVKVPDDGSTTHQFRYQAPEGQTKGVTIYVKTGDTWQETETELMGAYHLFTVDGNAAEIAVSVKEKGIKDYLPYIIGGVVVVGGALVLIIKKKSAKMKKAKTEEKNGTEDVPVS